MSTAEQEVNARLCFPGKHESHITNPGLPADVMDKAVTRLGWLGLLFAATLHMVHWTRISFTPFEGSDTGLLIANIALIAGTVLGISMSALAWSKRVSHRLVLDAGILFQVAAAFCVAVIEFRIRIHTAEPIVGVSGMALWIAFFVLVVPTTLGKAALGAMGSALMGPLALLVYSAVETVPLPSSGRMLSIFLPDLLAAAWSLLLSRYVYGMGHALGTARRMGYYELTERVGHGGMGEVWRAKHRMLARPAAIKLIAPEALGQGGELTSTLIRRFEREAQTTATLQSQHTVQVYDFGVTEDGALYYVMEYLEGLNLQTLIESYGPIPPERAVHFLLQMLESLDEAHRAGLVHRDIKPANIIAGKYGIHYDFIKVLDFGLARCVEARCVESTHNTGTMFPMVAGTPAFMAPESALNTHDADVRADLYAVGAVGYWMLTGRLLFEGLSDYETLLQHIHNVPVPPSEKSETTIPPELDRVIMACLEKNPNDRPQTAAELIARLKAIPLAPAWTPERAEHWWQAHRPSIHESSVPAEPDLAGEAA
ncbi:MAG TPA: serine/threonine-protein kinase [Terriglobia bacterium]|nr:serine/threonine-protein kinase [Terriglobia bacterium]